MNTIWRLLQGAIIVPGVLAFSGCYEPVVEPELRPAAYEPLVLPAVKYDIAGRSVLGRPLVTAVLGGGEDVTFILATIHGDEPAGTPIARRLVKYVQERPELLRGRRVLVLAVANPDGMASGRRENSNNVDINRNFSAANRTNVQEHGSRALSEPEAVAIHRLIGQYKPDRIVSIHQRHPQRPACVDYDGPAKELAERMAALCSIPVIKLGAKPGSLGSYAGEELGIPIITLEMAADDSELDGATLWRKYGAALVSAVAHSDALR